MDIVNHYPDAPRSDTVKNDIRRIVSIWREMRQLYGRQSAGDQGFLFGPFTVTDAMYAPVVTRFATYEADLAEAGDDGMARAYMDCVLTLPAMRDWAAGAQAELAARER